MEGLDTAGHRWTPAGHSLDTTGHQLDTAGHRLDTSWTPAGHSWTPQQHTKSHQRTWDGAVGSVLALKKGKWSKSAQLGGGRVVLALAEGVFRAPPAVDWILEAFHGPKSTLVVSQHRIPAPCQLQSLGAGSSSSLSLSRVPTASSVQSFSVKIS